MKILQITPFYEPHLGGIETHVKFLNQELIKAGHEVSVLTQRHNAVLPFEEKITGVSVYRIDTEVKHYNKLSYKLTLWRQLAKQSQLLLRADVIQVHDVLWWLIPLLPLFWSKIYLTFHGWEGEFPVPWQHKLARWCWSKLSLKTIHVGSYIQEFYWDKPTLVIYGGVKKNKISKQPFSKNKTLKIVFVGRLEVENEIEKYLSLAKKLTSAINVEITWVGDGRYKDKCQRYGKVTGMVKNLGKYIAAADLIWSASYLSILEAQALGKIVCAFYSHQLKEKYLKLYPGAKFMLIANRETDMMAQIMKLVGNKIVFNRYSRLSKDWAKQQTWKKIADKYQQLWGLR